MELRGRPRKHDRDEITALLNEYTDTTEIPIVAEFCYLNGLIRQYLYEMSKDHEDLSDAIKRCTEKKEVQLEKKALVGDVNHTMAIFSLKQLGWKDKQEVEHTGETTHNVNTRPDLSKLSVEELKNIENILSKTADIE